MSILKQIDNYFNSKSKKEEIYTYILIALVIGFIMYYFIYPKAKEYEEKQISKNATLISKKNALEITQRTLQTRITVLERRIKELLAELESLKKQKTFYTELTSLLNFANFDKHKWANLVKESVDSAKEEGMKVYKVSNNIYDDVNETNKTNFLVKRMDMDMYLGGDYKNFIFYMYNFENRKDLIKISEINVTSPTNYHLKISVYGFVK